MDALDLLVTTVTSMREEQRQDHQALVVKVDDIAHSIAHHSLDDTSRFAALETRLEPIEAMRKTMRWTAGTMFVGLAYAVIDILFNHFHK